MATRRLTWFIEQVDASPLAVSNICLSGSQTHHRMFPSHHGALGGAYINPQEKEY
jgi:hypothetical protein